MMKAILNLDIFILVFSFFVLFLPLKLCDNWLFNIADKQQKKKGK
jgi:hypothetical protein